MIDPSTSELADSEEFAAALLGWFDRHGRKDLPWQLEPTPYRVWVSEIMLQQTQVAVVIPYFERFLARFPDLASLAAAGVDEVLALWSGLGYYARARNLHRAARLARDHHGGQLPSTLETLMELPGIGRSTAGAILSLALRQRQAILDGNVKRVLTRVFAISGWPGNSGVQAQLWAMAWRLTPAADPGGAGDRVAAFNQAMMDLGATICTRHRPRCEQCPLRRQCHARTRGEQSLYPSPKPQKQRPKRVARWLIIRNPAGAWLLEQRPPIGLWGGLWTLPEIPQDRNSLDWCQQYFGLTPWRLEKLPPRRHSFSHFDLLIEADMIDLGSPPNRVAEGASARWVSPCAARSLGLPAPVKQLLEEFGASPSRPPVAATD